MPEPAYFGLADSLFGWVHCAVPTVHRSPVVICPPLGFEYIRTHQTLRRLAEKLSSAGFFVLRFDYDGCGDSHGSDRDPDRLASWLQSIRAAADFARDCSGRSDVALVGLRMGATLACKSMEEVEASWLVLWNPCMAGAAFVREMQIVAQANGGNAAMSGEVDAAGFILTEATVQSLSAVRLLQIAPAARPRVLLVDRADMPDSKQLQNHLATFGLPVEKFRAAGYTDMMLPPQRSIVPGQTLDSIADWLLENCPASDDATAAPFDASRLRNETSLAFSGGAGVRESAHRFGSDRRLAGIVSNAASSGVTGLPAIVLLCGGAVHRVSANRMFVPLARALAAHGFTVLRFDLSGIGDSAVSPGGRVNQPYAATACDDVNAALAMLGERFGARRFVLAGLCSGAYTAMQAARDRDDVVGLTLINQLVYFLSPAARAAAESATGFDARSEDYPRQNTLFDRLVRKFLRRTTGLRWPAKLAVRRALGGDPSRALCDFAARDIAVDFLFSEGDPAYEALMLFAGPVVRTLCRDGSASLSTIPNCDHTFSPQQSQDDLIARVLENLVARWQPRSAPGATSGP